VTFRATIRAAQAACPSYLAGRSNGCRSAFEQLKVRSDLGRGALANRSDPYVNHFARRRDQDRFWREYDVVDRQHVVIKLRQHNFIRQVMCREKGGRHRIANVCKHQSDLGPVEARQKIVPVGPIYRACVTVRLEDQLALIRSRGHLPKGGYDVQNGIRPNDTTRATRVH
jgi:hypothetical protein